MALLDRYLLRTALTPLSFSLLIAALLLLLEQMLRLLDLVLVENGPVDVIWRMLAYLLPHYLSLALPLSVFLGVVIGLRKLTLSSEFDVALAAGMSPWRLLRPLFLLATGMMVINFLILAYVQPYARYEFNQLRYELRAGLLGARVPVGKFVSIADGVRLRIGGIGAEAGELEDIFLSYKSENGVQSTFTAAEGQFVKSADGASLILRLMNGRQMIAEEGRLQPGVLTFDRQDISIPLPDVEAFRTRGGEEREATFDELLTLVMTEGGEGAVQYTYYRASLHFRLIHTLTFLALPFLGGAAAAVNRRQPRQTGPILGLAFVILYHELLEEWATYQVEAGLASPYLIMWPLFTVFLVASIALFGAAYGRVGGYICPQPWNASARV